MGGEGKGINRKGGRPLKKSGCGIRPVDKTARKHEAALRALQTWQQTERGTNAGVKK
jgi:hypothetical protein